MSETVIRAKVDSELKVAFFAVCKDKDLKPSQAIRHFMQRTVEKNRIPNILTQQTIENSEAGTNVYKSSSLEDLFNQLDK